MSSSTTLSSVGAQGVAGKTAVFFATLTNDDDGTGVAGQTIFFSLDLGGGPALVGGGLTDGSGLAVLNNVDISQVVEGFFPGIVDAEFKGDPFNGFDPSDEIGDLTVFAAPEEPDPSEPEEPEEPYEPEVPEEPEAEPYAESYEYEPDPNQTFEEESSAIGAPTSTNPFEGGTTPDAYTGDVSGEPFSQCSNYYTDDECVNPYTAGPNLDPYGDGACINPYWGSQDADAYSASQGQYARNIAYSANPDESSVAVTFDSWSADMLTQLEGRPSAYPELDYPEELVKNPELYASDESWISQKDERLATRRLTDDFNEVDQIERFQGLVDEGAEDVSDIEKGTRFGQDRRFQLEPARGTTTTGIRDTKAGTIRNGEPVGDWLVRVDGPHANAPEPHFNYNPELTGLDDPHYQMSEATFEALGESARFLEAANKIAIPLAVTIDSVRLVSAINEDIRTEGTLGPRTLQTGASVAGGWGGAYGGAVIGAEMGAAFGGVVGSFVPVLGNVVGAGVIGFAGGLVGGIGGAYFGSKWLEDMARK